MLGTPLSLDKKDFGANVEVVSRQFSTFLRLRLSNDVKGTQIGVLHAHDVEGTQVDVGVLLAEHVQAPKIKLVQIRWELKNVPSKYIPKGS